MLSAIQLAARPVALSMALFVFGGCEARQLYVAHDTVIGINANVNQTRTSGRVIVGYDRYFITLVPRSADMPPPENGQPPDEDDREAMSVLSCSKMQIEGVFLTEFTERLATGRAAHEFSKAISPRGTGEQGNQEQENKPESGEQFFDCF